MRESNRENGLVRRGGMNGFGTFGDWMDSLFGSIFDDGMLVVPRRRRGLPSLFDGGQTNRIAVRKDGKVVGYKYQCALPGFTRDEIDVTLDKGMVTVHASKKAEDSADEQYEHRGISYSDATYSYSLPENADLDSVGGKFENGLLTISVGLKELPGHDVKRIEVK